MLKLINWLYAHGPAPNLSLTAWVRHFSNCLLEKLGGINYSSVQSKQTPAPHVLVLPGAEAEYQACGTASLVLTVSLLQKYLKDCFLALEDSLLVHVYVRS